MPFIDWSSANASGGGGSIFTLPNDGYVCTITSATWGKSRTGNDQLKITWEVAEGPYANVCADNGWYESKHCDYISFAASALRHAQKKLNAIAASNPGFDPFAAIAADQFQDFVGRSVGLVLKLEYGEWQGKQTKKMVVDAYKGVADIRAGNFVKPETEEPPAPQRVAAVPVPQSFGQPYGYQQASQIPDESIPF